MTLKQRLTRWYYRHFCTIIIYGRDDCKYCTLAKLLCEQRGLTHAYYTTVALSPVPQIWVLPWHMEKFYLGGYNELKGKVG